MVGIIRRVPESPHDFVAALDPFDSADTARLRRYVANAHELAKSTFLGEELRYRLRMKRGEPYEVQTREPDETVGAWLLRFRLLHQEGRQTSSSFIRMHALIRGHLRDSPEGDQLRDALKRFMGLRRQARKRTGIQLHIDTGQITPGQALDDWLNGFYFHDDEDKRERIEDLRPFGFHHYLALGAARDLTGIYLGFSTHIVRPVTEEPRLCPSALN